MSREKFSIGDLVEVNCAHVKTGQKTSGWVPGVVIEADYRMAAVRFDVDVYSSNGWLIPDRILWLAHGSKNIRRADKE
ncbi:MAG: hypothetical protein HY260_04865 [Chloroflexi bacterium]|nr:hypothetical protein [Chloroflexota bacterium]